MKRLLLLLWVMFVPVTVALGQTPLKPAKGIYDPEAWLVEDDRREMESEIAGARERGEAAIFVVILPQEAAADVDQAALAMGRSWGGEDLWGLLLHVIDDPDSPRYFGEFGGGAGWTEQQRSDFQVSIQRSLSGAARKAKLAADPRAQVTSGTRILSEELGYLGHVVVEKIEHTNAQARGGRGAGEKGELETKSVSYINVTSIFLVVIGVLIVISVIVFFRLKNEEDREMEYLFPETTPRKRFLGPWSGGGNVLVQFDNTSEGNGRESERKF